MAQSILKTKSNVGPKMINTICLYLFSRYSLFVFFIYVLCIYIVCVCVFLSVSYLSHLIMCEQLNQQRLMVYPPLLLCLWLPPTRRHDRLQHMYVTRYMSCCCHYYVSESPRGGWMTSDQDELCNVFRTFSRMTAVLPDKRKTFSTAQFFRGLTVKVRERVWQSVRNTFPFMWG